MHSVKMPTSLTMYRAFHDMQIRAYFCHIEILSGEQKTVFGIIEPSLIGAPGICTALNTYIRMYCI